MKASSPGERFCLLATQVRDSGNAISTCQSPLRESPP